MKKLLFSIIVCMLFPVAMFAQIGYQVSLLNSATGEPRANERVSVTVEITNNAGEAIFSSTQNATSNDFGIISLTIGNADTFKDVDWAKLPFFIAVTIEGKLIAKSQILNVPLAEAAKTLVPAVSLDELCGKSWEFSDGFHTSNIIFYKDKSFKSKSSDSSGGWAVTTGKFFVEGRYVYIYDTYSDVYSDKEDEYWSTGNKVAFCIGQWWDGEFYKEGSSYIL